MQNKLIKLQKFKNALVVTNEGNTAVLFSTVIVNFAFEKPKLATTIHNTKILIDYFTTSRIYVTENSKQKLRILTNQILFQFLQAFMSHFTVMLQRINRLGA